MGAALLESQDTYDQREWAAADAIAWGFPRSIFQYEVTDGFWYRLGEHVVFWYEGGQDPDELAIHIAVAPSHRLRWPARSFIKVYAETAQQLGAKRLRFIHVDGGVDVRSILARMGWQPDAMGLYKEVGP